MHTCRPILICIFRSDIIHWVLGEKNKDRGKIRKKWTRETEWGLRERIVTSHWMSILLEMKFVGCGCVLEYMMQITHNFSSRSKKYMRKKFVQNISIIMIVELEFFPRSFSFYMSSIPIIGIFNYHHNSYWYLFIV